MYQIPKTNWTADNAPTKDDMNRIEGNIGAIANIRAFPTAGGSGTAITVTTGYFELVNGMQFTFIASAANGAAATTLNCDGAGAKPLYKAGTAVAPNLISGKAYTVWYNSASACFFIKASAEGTATTAQVLAGVPFSNESDTGLIGAMPEIGSVGTIILDVNNEEYTIPAGHHNGLGKVKAIIAGILASVIKAGTTVGGILGTFTSDATATAAQILSGVTAYVNGNKVTGTMPNRSGVYQDSVLTDGTSTLGTVYMKPPKGFYDESNTAFVKAYDADFIPANFLATKSIFDLQGAIPVKVADYGGDQLLALGITSTAGVVYLQVQPNTYLSGINWIRKDDPNFIQANIPNGMPMLGLVGTNTNKRWATDMVSHNYEYTTFYSWNNGYEVTNTFYKLTLTGLSFTPSTVMIFDSTGLMTLVSTLSDKYYDGYWHINIQNGELVRLTSPAYLTQGGFCLPVKNYGGPTFRYIAFE